MLEILFFLSVLGVERLSEELSKTDNCVKLSECESYSWLASNGYHFGVRQSRISNMLREMRCDGGDGDGDGDYIYCPKPKFVTGEKNIEEEMMSRSRFSTSGSTDHFEVQSSCMGSLAIYYVSRIPFSYKEVTLVYDEAQQIFRRSNLGLSESHQAVHMKSDGNCCWILFEKEKSRGKHIFLQLFGDTLNASVCTYGINRSINFHLTNI